MLKNFIAKILILSTLLVAGPYDLIRTQIAHAENPPPLEPGPEGFDFANSTWEWRHEDKDGGRWIVINTIKYTNGQTGEVSMHKLKYAQQVANGDSTFSFWSPHQFDANSKATRSSAGQYWLKLEEFDNDGVAGYNIWTYIYQPGADQPWQGSYTNSFDRLNFRSGTIASQRKIYGLYQHVDNGPGGDWTKMDSGSQNYKAQACIDKNQIVIIPDRTGFPLVEMWIVNAADWITGEHVDQSFSNGYVEARCLEPYGSRYPENGTTFERYLAQAQSKINGVPLEMRPNVTEQYVTPAQNLCKDAVIGPAEAQKNFLSGAGDLFDTIMENAVDNFGEKITISRQDKSVFTSKLQGAFDGTLNSDHLIAPIDGTGELYQKYYGGYGQSQVTNPGWATPPQTTYPNMYFDDNTVGVLEREKARVEAFKKIDPANSITIGGKTMDVDKSIMKAAEASSKKGSKEFDVIQLIKSKGFWNGVYGAGIAWIILQSNLLGMGAALASWWAAVNTVATYYIISTLTTIFGTILAAVIYLSIIVFAVIVGVVVVLHGIQIMRNYWTDANIVTTFRTMYAFYLGTQAAAWQNCMVEKVVNKGLMPASQAEAIGLTEANLANSNENLKLVKEDLANMIAGSIPGDNRDEHGCPKLDIVNALASLDMIEWIFCSLAYVVKEFIVRPLIMFAVDNFLTPSIGVVGSRGSP